MQKIKQTYHRLLSIVRRHPWRSSLIVAGGVVGICGIMAMVPRTIHFSYAGDSCIGKLTVLPQILTSTGATHTAVVKDVVSIGGVELFGRSICAAPRAAPQPGTQSARLSVGGIAFPAVYLRIATPDAPAVALDPVKKPIAAARPLTLPLSGHDEVFTYVLSAGERSVDCKTGNQVVTCDIATLELAQGETQSLQLARLFADQKVATLFDNDVDVLPAVAVTDSSVAEGATVYTKGQPFVMTVDKPLATAVATLTRRDGDAVVEHRVEVQADSTQITIVPDESDEELPRNAAYILTLEDVEAIDGSALAGPHQINFTLSGGPKITSVSVGSTGIDPHARIVLRLDQPRKADQPIADVVKVAGAPAVIAATNDTIVVTLAGADRCADVTLTVLGGLASEHDVAAGDSWQFKGRTRCHSIETIGYSVQGRPINSYIFGNGGSTYLFTGAIHGNELSSRYTMERFVADLEANPGRIPANARVVVVPIMNPDGVLRAHRNNANNVNLNRNFPTANWTSDTEVSGGRVEQGAGGPSAGSEPETQALMRLTHRYAPRLVVTHHSQGYLVNSNDVGISVSAGQTYAQLARYRFVPSSATAATFGFEMTGTYESWTISRGTPTILIELDTNTGNHYPRNSAAMWAMLSQ